jgi:hypothetical protein
MSRPDSVAAPLSTPWNGAAVFEPCLTLSVDDCGRRWLAEQQGPGLAGPFWCVLPDPQVAIYLGEDVAAFFAGQQPDAPEADDGALRRLQSLTATARTIWSARHVLALRPHHLFQVDQNIRAWLSTLPPDAYVYDLRDAPPGQCGWPYGVAGPSSRLYRCGRSLVFAAAASPTEGWFAEHPARTAPRQPSAHLGLELPSIPASQHFRRRRFAALALPECA